MSSNAELATRVITLIQKSPEVLEDLETQRITWCTPCVEIENTLNKNLPHIYKEQDLGIRKLTETETINRFKKWQEKKINGKVKYPSECGGLYWKPPESEKLYVLTQYIQLESRNKLLCEYYLLTDSGKYVFLKKKFGRENSLRVLIVECQDNQFSETLKAFLAKYEPNK